MYVSHTIAEVLIDFLRPQMDCSIGTLSKNMNMEPEHRYILQRFTSSELKPFIMFHSKSTFPRCYNWSHVLQPCRKLVPWWMWKAREALENCQLLDHSICSAVFSKKPCIFGHDFLYDQDLHQNIAFSKNWHCQKSSIYKYIYISLATIHRWIPINSINITNSCCSFGHHHQHPRDRPIRQPIRLIRLTGSPRWPPLWPGYRNIH